MTTQLEALRKNCKGVEAKLLVKKGKASQVIIELETEAGRHEVFGNSTSFADPACIACDAKLQAEQSHLGPISVAAGGVIKKFEPRPAGLAPPYSGAYGGPASEND